MLSRVLSSSFRGDSIGAQHMRLYLNNSRNTVACSGVSSACIGIASSGSSSSSSNISGSSNSNSNSIFASRLIQVRHSGSGKRRPSKSPRLNWKEKVQLGLDKPLERSFKPKPFGYVDEDLQHLRKEGDFTVKLAANKSFKEPEFNIDLNIRKILVPSSMFGSKKTSGIIEGKPAKKSFSHSRVFGQSIIKNKGSASTSAKN